MAWVQLYRFGINRLTADICGFYVDLNSTPRDLIKAYLELVGLDVLPERRDDDGPRLGVDTQQPGQTLVKLELEWLVVQQQEDRATNVLVTRTFHLGRDRLNVY